MMDVKWLWVVAMLIACEQGGGSGKVRGDASGGDSQATSTASGEVCYHFPTGVRCTTLQPGQVFDLASCHIFERNGDNPDCPSAPFIEDHVPLHHEDGLCNGHPLYWKDKCYYGLCFYEGHAQHSDSNVCHDDRDCRNGEVCSILYL